MSLNSKCTNAYNLNSNSVDSVAANNGTDTSVTYSGTYATYNGSTSKSSIPDNTSFTFGSSDFAIAVWFKKASNGSYMAMLGQSNSSATLASCSIVMEFTPSNIISIEIFIGTSGFYPLASASTITDTNWHLAIVNRVGDFAYLYIDNALSSSRNLPTSGIINDSTNNMVIGQYGEYTARPWNGSIGGVYFFKGNSLTTTEMTQLYNNGSFFKYPFSIKNSNFLAFF